MGDAPARPEPPLPVADARAPARFPSTGVDDAFVTRLARICPVDVEPEATAAAARDWWPLSIVWAKAGELPARPGAVARPGDAGEVAAVLRLCHELHVPVTAAAGRSGVCGGSVPVFGGVTLDLTGLAGISAVDAESGLVDVRAGTFGDDFEASLRRDHDLTCGHWPQSMALSTVGGWLACRSAGQYSTRYGKIEDMVVGVEAALADGRVVRTGAGPRAAMGPDLTQVFVGSEGTLGVITEARLRCHPLPAAERKGAWSFETFAAGLDACRRILRRGATPAVLRLYDPRESRRSFDLTDGSCVLIVLDEGDSVILDAVMAVVAEECGTGQPLPPELVDRWLAHRNDVSGLGTAVEQGVVVDTCEVAAPWSVLPALYEAGVAAVKAVPDAWVASAHQSHAYTDGACLYFTFAGQRDADPDGFYQDAWNALTEATLRHGGALSHHHGIGLNRGRFMAEALGSSFPVLVTLKQSLDPHGILNPGKLGLPHPFGPAVPWP